jgi:anti-sigma factor RsiW
MNRVARHRSTEELVDFAEGRLPDADRRTVETHLATCTLCGRQAAAFGHLIEVMRTDDSEDTAVHVLNRAIRLFRTQRLESTPAVSRRHILAVLRLDTARQAFAPGLRSVQPAARELLFEIDDDNEIEVRIEPADGGWRVAGQVLGSCSGGQVVLEGAAGRASTELNALCEFSLPPQPGAIYKLVLQLEDADVEVPILELRG